MIARWRGLTVTVALASIVVLSACDGYFSFYIRNDGFDTHFVRVTTERGRVYVHEILPHKSGYASRGVLPGGQGAGYELELLDSTCRVLEAWSMPGDGGHLHIGADGVAEFAGGAYFEVRPTGTTPRPAPSIGPFPTVMECSATNTLDR